MTKYITIPGFESLSQQEIFDIALNHMRKTRKPGMSGGTCSYKGGCAASPFIAPEHIEEASGSWNYLWTHKEVPAHFGCFIAHIQGIHDRAANYWDESNDFQRGWVDFMNEFELGMERLAQDHGLVYKAEEN